MRSESLNRIGVKNSQICKATRVLSDVASSPGQKVLAQQTLREASDDLCPDLAHWEPDEACDDMPRSLPFSSLTLR